MRLDELRHHRPMADAGHDQQQRDTSLHASNLQWRVPVAVAHAVRHAEDGAGRRAA